MDVDDALGVPMVPRASFVELMREHSALRRRVAVLEREVLELHARLAVHPSANDTFERLALACVRLRPAQA